MGNKMQTGIIIYAVMGLMFVLIILLAAMVLQLRAKVSALQNRYRYFMTGEKGESLERQLAAEVTELREMTRSGEDMLHQHELLSNMQIRSFQRIGLVKYDAFDDSGDHLSFSLTLLDGENNGFVLSSLVGRETSRIYAKQVVNGLCRDSISSEEADSINMALAYEQPRHTAAKPEDGPAESESYKKGD